MKLDKIHNTPNLKSCHSKFLQLLCSVRRPVIFCTRMEKYRAQAQAQAQARARARAQAQARAQIQAQIPIRAQAPMEKSTYQWMSRVRFPSTTTRLQ